LIKLKKNIQCKSMVESLFGSNDVTEVVGTTVWPLRQWAFSFKINDQK